MNSPASSNCYTHTHPHTQGKWVLLDDKAPVTLLRYRSFDKALVYPPSPTSNDVEILEEVEFPLWGVAQAQAQLPAGPGYQSAANETALLRSL